MFYYGDIPTYEGTTSLQLGREANASLKEIPTEWLGSQRDVISFICGKTPTCEDAMPSTK